MTTKICSKCKQNKSLCEFGKYKSGLSCWCRSCKRKSDKDYYSNNTKKILTHNNLWKNKHKKERIEYNKMYCRARRKDGSDFKLLECLRSRIYKAIKYGHGKKNEHTISLLGCNLEKFKLYLSSKFQPRMTWKNYGKWYIDHILPCSIFDLTDYQERKFCFHYTNLQPLWAKDNLSKSDKIS
jgi:hypothetical protein